MADRPASPKLQTFLVAVKQKRVGTRVYAVRAASPQDAFDAVRREVAAEDAMIELAGSLSKGMTRSLKLKPGEARQV